MEIKDELKEILLNNAASWGKKEGDDLVEIYVDDFLNELLNKFSVLPMASVISSVSSRIHYDLALKAMQLMVDKEELTGEELRELPELKQLWLAMDVIKEHYL